MDGNEYMDMVCKRLEAARQDRSVTTRWLAQKIGLVPSTVRRILDGKIILSADKLYDMAAALGVPLYDLVITEAHGQQPQAGQWLPIRNGEGEAWYSSPLPAGSYAWRVVSRDLAPELLPGDILAIRPADTVRTYRGKIALVRTADGDARLARFAETVTDAEILGVAVAICRRDL